MAVTLEQVEQLRARSDVSYEEARDALERSGGDLLEALIDLERRGKTRAPGGGGRYSTCPGGGEVDVTALVAVPSQAGGRERSSPGFWAQLKELLLALLNLLRQSLSNQFEVWRKGERLTSIPILILIILVIVAFWIVVPLLVVALFFDCQYRFSGPDLNREKADEVMGKVSHTVNGVIDQIKDGFWKCVAKVKDRCKKT